MRKEVGRAVGIRRVQVDITVLSLLCLLILKREVRKVLPWQGGGGLEPNKTTAKNNGHFISSTRQD